jgi:predicted nucleic acid-binding protein
MLIIDSTGWIEFFTSGRRSPEYEKYLKDLTNLITPTVVIYEVYKKIKKERSEEDALLAVALMNRTSVVSLHESISLSAADVSIKHSLPMADAIVYATGLEKECSVVTSDSHFKNLDKVIFIE